MYASGVCLEGGLYQTEVGWRGSHIHCVLNWTLIMNIIIKNNQQANRPQLSKPPFG
jgi:hypothetical protein